MTKEKLILNSCKYAVEQMLEKGNCIFIIKEGKEIYKIDYAEVHEYLKNELKGSDENG